mmetsp:Transcript_29334/g.96524  ORF Transcript_29334/g.96524 Transcript_29334/m.96524 type:complete len:257 (-) Transcript_29334:210-980(-)
MSSCSPPDTSMLCNPPSRCTDSVSFSSSSSCTGAFDWAAAAAAPAAPAAAPGGGAPKSAISPSCAIACSSDAPPSPFFAPSCMPVPFFTGFAYGGGAGAPPPAKPPKPASGGPPAEAPAEVGSNPMPPPPPPPPPMPPMAFAPFSRLIVLAFRFISSCASRSLDWRIMIASFSSCESISMCVWMSWRERLSEWPRATTSSKAKTSSNAERQTAASSSSPGQYSERTCAKRRSVSRSSTMLECLFVIMTRSSPSIGR